MLGLCGAFWVSTISIIGYKTKKQSDKYDSLLEDDTTYIDEAIAQKVVLESGKHVFCRLIDNQTDVVNVPDGYKVLNIDYDSNVNYYCVWYVNTETVEATPVYDEYDERYEYTEFGKVVETRENDALTLTRKLG